MSVLIVDDEAEFLEVLHEILGDAGIRVDTAKSAVEALQLHRRNRYLVMVSDIRMPGMTGVELIRQIKQINPTCIVFIMTGHPSIAGLVECLEAGAVDYFVKPIQDFDLLTDALRSALKRQERWRGDLVSMRGSEREIG